MFLFEKYYQCSPIKLEYAVFEMLSCFILVILFSLIHTLQSEFVTLLSKQAPARECTFHDPPPVPQGLQTPNTHRDLATCLRLSAHWGLRTAHIWKSPRDSWIFPSRRNIKAAKREKTQKIKSCSKNGAWHVKNWRKREVGNLTKETLWITVS